MDWDVASAQFLVRILDDVREIDLRQAVQRLQGIEYFHGQLQQTLHFDYVFSEPEIEDCLQWAEKPTSAKGVCLKEELSQVGEQRLAAVRAWTGDASYVVTSRLRDKNRSKRSLEPVLPLLRLVLSGLHRLPERFIFQGDIYRAEYGIRANWDQAVRPGSPIQWFTMLSFTRDAEVLSKFKSKEGPRTITCLHGGCGYLLSDLSIHASENEVVTEGVSRGRVQKAEKYDAGHLLCRAGEIKPGLHILHVSARPGFELLTNSPAHRALAQISDEAVPAQSCRDAKALFGGGEGQAGCVGPHVASLSQVSGDRDFSSTAGAGAGAGGGGGAGDHHSGGGFTPHAGHALPPAPPTWPAPPVPRAPAAEAEVVGLRERLSHAEARARLLQEDGGEISKDVEFLREEQLLLRRRMEQQRDTQAGVEREQIMLEAEAGCYRAELHRLRSSRDEATSELTKERERRHAQEVDFQKAVARLQQELWDIRMTSDVQRLKAEREHDAACAKLRSRVVALAECAAPEALELHRTLARQANVEVERCQALRREKEMHQHDLENLKDLREDLKFASQRETELLHMIEEINDSILERADLPEQQVASQR